MKNTVTAWGFVFPSFTLIAVFKLYPIFVMLVQSFYQDDFLNSGEKIFIGLDNFVDLFTDNQFYNSLWVTLKLNLVINPFQIAVSFVMALIINAKFSGVSLYRMTFYVPLGVSLAVATTYWSIILKPDNGAINQVLYVLGLPRQAFYFSSGQALWVIVLIASWKGCSFWMIYLHAGLQDVSKAVLEASKIDGAGPLQRLFLIIVPLMKRPLLFVLVTDTSVNFMLFIPVFMITKGGPDSSTNVLLYEAFKSGILQGDMGRAFAISTVLLVILATILAIQFFALKNDE